MSGTCSARQPAIILVIGIAFLFAIQAAHSADDPLPAEARQALDRGLIAAEQEAWQLAIGYFTQAQKAAPTDPRVLYSLGLAHAKAGHELAGAAWLRAYLHAVPQAANAGAVDREILRLERVVEGNVKKIFEAALAASRETPSSEVRKHRLFYIFTWQLYTGDFEGGRKTQQEDVDLWVSQSPDEAADLRQFLESLLWAWHVQHLAYIGEVQKAQEAVGRIQDWKMKMTAECHVAKGLSWIGDFEGAQKRLALAERALNNLNELCAEEFRKGSYKDADDPGLRGEQAGLMLELADAYAANGRVADYRRILTEANRIADRYRVAAETRSKITAALQSDPNSKNLPAPLRRMNAVKEWIDLATELSTDKQVIDLKGRLEWAKNDKSSDGIANGLAAVALQLGKRLNKIHALEKRCAAAAALPSKLGVLQPSARSVFQLRLALDGPSADCEEMALVDKGRNTGGKNKRVLYLEKTPLLDHKAVKSALAVTDKVTGESYVSITFTKEGAEQFAEVTRDYIGKRLAIVVDGRVYSAPVIREEISGGEAQITGGITRPEARDLANKINQVLAK